MIDNSVRNAFGSLLVVGFIVTFLGFAGTVLVIVMIVAYGLRTLLPSQQQKAYYHQLASEEFDIVAEQVDNRVSGNAFANHLYVIQSQDSSTADFVDTLFGVER